MPGSTRSIVRTTRKLKLAAILRFALGVALELASSPAFAQDTNGDLVQQHWFEARTAHFNLYSCGPPQDVYKLVGRLEQFREAYGLLAGAQALATPPVIVMAFPSQEAMNPFLPLYKGKPANLGGFFNHGTDENLIVLPLSGTNTWSLNTIFHEYTHLLLRRNDRIWPPWLKEGMAEMYSTFEATGRGVRIGLPIQEHLQLLKNSEFMPLQELLTATHESADYNESDRQGLFYAQSWLLTHFLMNGDNLALKARFGNYTKLLRLGQPPDKALVNALGVSLPALEAELRRYLERGQFEPVSYVVSVDLSAPRPVSTRPIGQAEVCFRLGNELMRIDRLDDAAAYFARAQILAPQSPLSYEGLGLLAAEREQSAEAVRQLKEAFQRGPVSFLAHYIYARERFQMTGTGDSYTRVAPELAGELRSELGNPSA